VGRAELLNALAQGLGEEERLVALSAGFSRHLAVGEPEGLALDERAEQEAIEPLQGDPQLAPGEANDIHNAGERADCVEIGLDGVLDLGASLRGDAHDIAGPSVLQQRHRALATHRQRNDGARIKDARPEREERER
jgi:hypothetical protein